MRIVLIILSFSIAFISKAQTKSSDLAIARIQYIYKVKQALGNNLWSSFGDERYNIPLIYFNGDTTYIANPHLKFIRKYSPRLIYKKGKLKIFQLDFRIDTARMRMLTSMTNGPDTTLYDYNDPYMKCSSREEFINTTGFQPTTQGWVAIVLHECFHGFQYRHPAYYQYASQHNLINLSAGTALQNLYITYPWYKDYIDTENDLLLKAIAATGKQTRDSLIGEFLKVRAERRSHISSGSDTTFNVMEKNFETMEGTARFAEAYILSSPLKDKDIMAVDPHFNKDNVAAPLADIESLAMASTGNYYYATGYNMIRLLKKMNVDYSKLFFKQPSLTLEDVLWQQTHKPVKK